MKVAIGESPPRVFLNAMAGLKDISQGEGLGKKKRGA
jgi:hypothetical protein